jgi:hypothetical protein
MNRWWRLIAVCLILGAIAVAAVGLDGRGDWSLEVLIRVIVIITVIWGVPIAPSVALAFIRPRIIGVPLALSAYAVAVVLLYLFCVSVEEDVPVTDFASVRDLMWPAIPGLLLICYILRGDWGKPPRGFCPQCEYDLRGQLAAGCPECGWNR